MDKTKIEPHENDVLCGRGGSINNHVGNENYRTFVNRKKRVYLTARFKREKRLIAASIVQEVRALEPQGRFLAKDSRSGAWYDIGDLKARDKTSQALREGAPEIRKEMESDRKKELEDSKMCGDVDKDGDSDMMNNPENNDDSGHTQLMDDNIDVDNYELDDDDNDDADQQQQNSTSIGDTDDHDAMAEELQGEQSKSIVMSDTNEAVLSNTNLQQPLSGENHSTNKHHTSPDQSKVRFEKQIQHHTDANNAATLDSYGTKNTGTTTAYHHTQSVSNNFSHHKSNASAGTMHTTNDPALAPPSHNNNIINSSSDWDNLSDDVPKVQKREHYSSPDNHHPLPLQQQRAQFRKQRQEQHERRLYSDRSREFSILDGTLSPTHSENAGGNEHLIDMQSPHSHHSGVGSVEQQPHTNHVHVPLSHHGTPDNTYNMSGMTNSMPPPSSSTPGQPYHHYGNGVHTETSPASYYLHSTPPNNTSVNTHVATHSPHHPQSNWDPTHQQQSQATQHHMHPSYLNTTSVPVGSPPSHQQQHQAHHTMNHHQNNNTDHLHNHHTITGDTRHTRPPSPQGNQNMDMEDATTTTQHIPHSHHTTSNSSYHHHHHQNHSNRQHHDTSYHSSRNQERVNLQTLNRPSQPHAATTSPKLSSRQQHHHHHSHRVPVRKHTQLVETRAESEDWFCNSLVPTEWPSFWGLTKKAADTFDHDGASFCGMDMCSTNSIGGASLCQVFLEDDPKKVNIDQEMEIARRNQVLREAKSWGSVRSKSSLGSIASGDRSVFSFGSADRSLMSKGSGGGEKELHSNSELIEHNLPSPDTQDDLKYAFVWSWDGKKEEQAE